MRRDSLDGIPRCSRGGRGLRLAAAVVFLVLPALAGPAPQAGKEGATNQAEEEFKEVDPYTKGDPELIRAAGYESLRPFPLTPGAQVRDVVEALGDIELVWAETRHFKICSSLKTYKSKADAKENAALDLEFAELAKRIKGFKPPKNRKLDPWLRLHLYAMRLEKIYAELSLRTGFQDSDFPPVGTTNAMGSGPYLGQPLKPTVLLAEKSSALGRFNRRFLNYDEERAHRGMLPGGSMFVGVSAESLRENGYEFDIALHCTLAATVVANLMDGLRDSHWATPLWLDMGLGHWFSRRIDPRYTYYAAGTTRAMDDDLYIWEPRIRGLVENKFEYSWRDMLGTVAWEQFTPQAHMLIWSRVDWMLQQKDGKMRAFLEPLTVNLPPGENVTQKPLQIERALKAFQDGFGRTPEECESAWRAWVLKTYPRK